MVQKPLDSVYLKKSENLGDVGWRKLGVLEVAFHGQFWQEFRML